MAERERARRRSSAREATKDGSRETRAGTGRSAHPPGASNPLATGVLILGILAGILMLISLFSPIASVDVANGSCEVINDANPELADRCSLSGFERHGVAFLLLAVVCLALAYGAGPGRSRPAAVGLLAVGVVALVFALLVDLPVTDDTGAIGRDFEGATASAGPGLWTEVISGLLALAAGALALLMPHSGAPPGRRGEPAADERTSAERRAERAAERATQRRRGRGAEKAASNDAED